MRSKASDLASRVGDVFFRWRSYLPLVLIPFMVLAIARWQLPLRSLSADRGWELGCVMLALAGFVLRVWTVGTAAPGTSGRNTRQQKARGLNTTGPYSVVRHPLYLANFVIAFGLSLFPHTWIAPPVVALLTIGYYACIAIREEEYLRGQFGAEFERWAAKVPPMIPRASRYAPPDRRFDWRLVIRREFYALAVILVTPLLLDLVEDSYNSERLVLDPLWTVVACIGAGQFVLLRFLKKTARS